MTDTPSVTPSAAGPPAPITPRLEDAERQLGQINISELTPEQTIQHAHAVAAVRSAYALSKLVELAMKGNDALLIGQQINTLRVSAEDSADATRTALRDAISEQTAAIVAALHS